MSWWEYVTRTSGTDSPKALTAATGIDGPSFSKWKAGHVPKPDTVARFARALGQPVLEAFVAAGFLTAAEAKARPAQAPDLTRLTNDELLAEVRSRMSREAGGDNVSSSTTQAGASPAKRKTRVVSHRPRKQDPADAPAPERAPVTRS